MTSRNRGACTLDDPKANLENEKINREYVVDQREELFRGTVLHEFYDAQSACNVIYRILNKDHDPQKVIYGEC